MASDDNSAFLTMLQNVGATLLDTQVKRIGKVYKVPLALHDSDGEKLLEVLHSDGKVLPSNVDELRRQLKRNFAGEAVKILDEFSGGPPALTELYNDATCVQTFIFRKEMADRLSEVVERPPEKRATQYSALVGEGGSGKTQMSLWFCEQMKGSDLYDVIWFMSGDGLEKFTEDLEDLMDELGIKYVGVRLRKLKRILTEKLNRKGKWLLVVDNLERMSLKDLKDLIPERGGTVLVTTRDSNIELPKDKIFNLRPFSDDETSNLFERILGKGLVFESDLKKIGKIFGYNALALSVCAYYLRELHVAEGETTLNIINDSLQKIIKESADKETKETITAMYERSLRVVKEKSPESWRMMEKLSLLGAEGVSREVVRKILKREELKSRNANASGDVRLQPKDSCGEYKTKESELMKDVLSLGLAEKRVDKYWVHRLMKKVIQERMKSKGDLECVLEEVVEDMYGIWIEDSRDNTLWKKKQEMGEHVESLAIHWEIQVTTKTRDELAWMIQNYSFYTIAVKGDLAAAEERINLARKVIGGGMCSKWVISALLSVRGDLETKQGMQAEALAHYKKALKMEEEESMRAHLHNNIGVCLKELERYPEALEEYEKALEIDTRYEGKDSVDVCNKLVNMGVCLSCMGEYEEALKKHRRAIEICESGKYTSISQLSAFCHNNLGDCYQKMSKYEEALERYRKAYEIFTEIHEKEDDNPDVARSLFNVGLVLSKLQLYHESKEYFLKLMPMRSNIQSATLPDLAEISSLKSLCNRGIVEYELVEYYTVCVCARALFELVELFDRDRI